MEVYFQNMDEGEKLDAVVSNWYSNFAVRHIGCMRQRFNSKFSFLGFYVESVFPSSAKIKTAFFCDSISWWRPKHCLSWLYRRGLIYPWDNECSCLHVICLSYVWHFPISSEKKPFDDLPYTISSYLYETLWLSNIRALTSQLVVLAPARSHVARMSVNCPASDRDVGINRSDYLLIPQLSGWYPQRILKLIHNFKSDTQLYCRKEPNQNIGVSPHDRINLTVYGEGISCTIEFCTEIQCQVTGLTVL